MLYSDCTDAVVGALAVSKAPARVEEVGEHETAHRLEHERSAAPRRPSHADSQERPSTIQSGNDDNCSDDHRRGRPSGERGRELKPS